MDAAVGQRATLELRISEVQDGIKAAEAELEGAENEVARLQVGAGGDGEDESSA